ncbi:tyrosine-type recombinase/integrase [Bradyrhizobium centrosematis]|uniref:tyrosine-type recombinase/integrase n=1 Tax=Bradyrhizobium centrosematis TaxID=1300039 RepID=UPI00388EA175
MRLADETKRFLDYCAVERQLSANTREAYCYDLADYRKWLSARTEEIAVSTDALRNYLEDMTNARGLSAGTIRRRKACLRSFFGYLEDEEKWVNPFVGWRLKLPRRRRLPRALSQREAGQLLSSHQAAAKEASPRARRSIDIELRLMVATGIRVGELCSLRTSDIWQDGSALRIRGKGARDRLVYVADPSLCADLLKLVSLRLKHLGVVSPAVV